MALMDFSSKYMSMRIKLIIDIYEDTPRHE